jgi:hypothetical protein
LALFAAAAVLGAAFFVIRKLLLRAEEPDDSLSMGFTLADLRAMHEQGQLSDEEFEYAKRKMTAKARAAFEPPDGDDPDSGPSPTLHLEND